MPANCGRPVPAVMEVAPVLVREHEKLGWKLVHAEDLLQAAQAGGVAPERATQRLIDGMTADGGGYILAASHTVPPETPDENIFAMYEVAGISRAEILDRAAAIRKINRC